MNMRKQKTCFQNKNLLTELICLFLMFSDPTIEEGDSRKGLELVRSVSDKQHPDLLRPSARYYSIFKGW